MSRRQTEFHYIDWHFARWFGSETRARCRALTLGEGVPQGLAGAAAVGVYLELIFYCAQDGSIPADIGGLAALAGVGPEVMDIVWPVIKGKFSPHKKLPNRLVNDEVNTRRRAWNSKRWKNSQAGTASALKRGIDKVIVENNIGNERSAVVQRAPNHIISNKKEVISNKKEVRTEEGACANGSHAPPAPRYAPFSEDAFDYAEHFRELWEIYPRKGRTKMLDSQRLYVEILTPDPDHMHEVLLVPLRQGGKWIDSDSWRRGYIFSLFEYLRNRRDLEDPEPFVANSGRRLTAKETKVDEILERKERERNERANQTSV